MTLLRQLVILVRPFKGIPGFFFIRTSLPKSSNNLELMCNYVNVKCSWLVILWIISVTSTLTVWETNATNVNLTNLKVIIFPIPWYLTAYSTLFTLLNQLPSWSSGSRVRASAETTFIMILFYFYWWIVITELFRHILKLILNYYFKFERNRPGSCFPGITLTASCLLLNDHHLWSDRFLNKTLRKIEHERKAS